MCSGPRGHPLDSQPRIRTLLSTCAFSHGCHSYPQLMTPFPAAHLDRLRISSPSFLFCIENFCLLPFIASPPAETPGFPFDGLDPPFFCTGFCGDVPPARRALHPRLPSADPPSQMAGTGVCIFCCGQRIPPTSAAKICPEVPLFAPASLGHSLECRFPISLGFHTVELHLVLSLPQTIPFSGRAGVRFDLMVVLRAFS